MSLALLERRTMMKADVGDSLITEGPDGRRECLIIGLQRADGAPPYVVRWLADGHIALVFPGPYTRLVHSAKDFITGSFSSADLSSADFSSADFSSAGPSTGDPGAGEVRDEAPRGEVRAEVRAEVRRDGDGRPGLPAARGSRPGETWLRRLREIHDVN